MMRILSIFAILKLFKLIYLRGGMDFELFVIWGAVSLSLSNSDKLFFRFLVFETKYIMVLV